MTLLQKEVFSLVSLDFVGISRRMGVFNTQEQALSHAENLQKENSKAEVYFNYIIVPFS